MSTQLLYGAVGAAVGFFVGGPTGAEYGWMAGVAIGGYLGAPDNVGPRLTQLSTQLSSYAAPIPIDWGTVRQAGNVIWPKTLTAVEHKHEQSAKGGPENITFTYTLSCAVLVCKGPIAGIRRIWANKKIVYDMSAGNTGAVQDPAISGLRIYLGTETQVADPLIVATDGPSPAYLGYAYVVFEDYDVTQLQGRPPQWEFEVLTVGAPVAPAAPVDLGTGGVTALVTNPSTGVKTLWSVSGANCYVYDMLTGALVTTIALPSTGTSITAGEGSPVWVGYSNSGFGGGICATPIDPVSYVLGTSTNFGYVGATTELGTVAYNPALLELYGFVNNGLGSGGARTLANSGVTGVSAIAVPSYVYASLEMPDVGLLAVAGNGNWLVLGSFATDAAVASLTNTAWTGTPTAHRLAYDASRHCVYWAALGRAGVYKVDLSTYTLSLLLNITGTGIRGLHFNSATGALYVFNGANLECYSPDDGSLLGSDTGHGVLAGQQFGEAIDVGSAEYFFASESGSPTGKLWKIYINGRLAPAQVLLGSIVSDLCALVNLAPGDIDVTQLTDLVDGFALGAQMTARAALQTLQQAYFFGAVESDDKIKFVKFGAAPVATIAQADRAARAAGGTAPEALSITRAFPFELPEECDIQYIDIAADLQVGNQYARRLTRATRQKLSLQLAIVMTAAKALQVARSTLYQAWLLNSYTFATTRQYAYLEPTDPIYLVTDAATYGARITTKREQPGGWIEWQAVMEDGTVYSQDGADAAATGFLPQTVFSPTPTVLVLMDIPLLRDDDDNPGFYVAMGGAA